MDGAFLPSYNQHCSCTLVVFFFLLFCEWNRNRYLFGRTANTHRHRNGKFIWLDFSGLLLLLRVDIYSQSSVRKTCDAEGKWRTVHVQTTHTTCRWRGHNRHHLFSISRRRYAVDLKNYGCFVVVWMSAFKNESTNKYISEIFINSGGGKTSGKEAKCVYYWDRWMGGWIAWSTFAIYAHKQICWFQCFKFSFGCARCAAQRNFLLRCLANMNVVRHALLRLLWVHVVGNRRE